jgi:hypothetical protein
MKRALLLLTVLLIGTSVFAAPKPQAIPPASSGINPGQISIGYWGGYPTLGYQFSKEIAVAGSLSYASSGSLYGILLKADYNLAKIGSLQPCVGLDYYTSSSGVWGNVGIFYGLSAMVLNNLSVGFDISLLEYTKTAGANSTNILSWSVMKASYYL